MPDRPGHDDAALAAWIQRLPKAALHVHLEGALRWATVCAWHPEGARLPAQPPWWQLADPFPDFSDFLEVFAQQVKPGTGVPAAIEQHTVHAAADLAAQGVVYAEPIISVPFHSERGLGQAEVLDAIARGVATARLDPALDLRVIYGLNRHRPIAEVEREFAEALDLVGAEPEGLLAGIDLQGDERVGEVRTYRSIFRRAEAAGLRLRAHAGELCGPDSVAAVVDELGVRQLSHGVRAVEDPRLLARLIDAGVVFHVCPTSNLKLHVAADHASHPLGRLLAAGCRVTIDADDPLLFGCTIVDEYRLLASAFGLDRTQIAAIARTGLEASLLPASRRSALLAQLDSLG